MVNRTALAAILLALSSPSWASNVAIQDARNIAGGHVLGTYDGGCTGGSCGVVPACEGEACRINQTADNALRTGGLIVAKDTGARPALIAEVPAPALGADKEGSKEKPGFFSNLFSGKGVMYGLGGAAAGAGIGFLLGGPIGALIGGLLGAVGGFLMSKLLS